MVILKAASKGSNGKKVAIHPEISSQSEGYSSHWLIWLACGEPLQYNSLQLNLVNIKVQVDCVETWLTRTN